MGLAKHCPHDFSPLAFLNLLLRLLDLSARQSLALAGLLAMGRADL
jgi:hypothetical protein